MVEPGTGTWLACWAVKPATPLTQIGDTALGIALSSLCTFVKMGTPEQCTTQLAAVQSALQTVLTTASTAEIQQAIAAVASTARSCGYEPLYTILGHAAAHDVVMAMVQYGDTAPQLDTPALQPAPRSRGSPPRPSPPDTPGAPQVESDLQLQLDCLQQEYSALRAYSARRVESLLQQIAKLERFIVEEGKSLPRSTSDSRSTSSTGLSTLLPASPPLPGPDSLSSAGASPARASSSLASVHTAWSMPAGTMPDSCLDVRFEQVQQWQHAMQALRQHARRRERSLRRKLAQHKRLLAAAMEALQHLKQGAMHIPVATLQALQAPLSDVSSSDSE